MAQKTTVAAIRPRDGLVEFSTDGNTYQKVFNAASYEVGSSELNEETITTLDGSTVINTPSTTTGAVTVPISAYLPHHPAFRELIKAKNDLSVLHWRITTVERQILGTTAVGVTAAIAVTGIVTLAGAQTFFERGGGAAVGMSLKIMGGTGHVISGLDLDADGDLMANGFTVFPKPAAPVAAARYSVVLPSLRTTFLGGVRDIGSVSGTTQGAMSGQLIISPSEEVQTWDPVYA